MTFYDKFAKYYDVIFHMTHDISFYKKLISDRKGKTLEIGCGTGRLFLELLKTKYPICGIDNSNQMLKHLNRKLKKYPKELRENAFVNCDDMMCFDSNDTFETILLSNSVFSHVLYQNDQILLLKKLKKCLSKTGVIVIHAKNPSMMPFLKNYHLARQIRHFKTVHYKTLKFMLSEFQTLNLDSPEYTQNVILDVFNNKNVSMQRRLLQFTYRINTTNDFERLFQSVGLEVINRWGNFDFSEMNEKSPFLIYLVKTVAG